MFSVESANSFHVFLLQLASARRERDSYKEQLLTAERKLADITQKQATEEKDWQQRIAKLSQQTEECEDLRTKLTQLQHEYDAARVERQATESMWKVERDQLIEQLPTVRSGIEKKAKRNFVARACNQRRRSILRVYGERRRSP